ncbi:hypothetical protein M413DRAFT_32925 [Hebeloma cylindrosporum]|uniref:T6SS Phospholipase effector Tle1-like catalytic domain-containing protein n=1 Tax=Hebeloma cylindrosporum TaxID=76867 RepID=A0A0C3BDM2_HEBCY|nr:hypothetical protein M413DRAFT_32925 [Hebeloma cylindrosporum h7]
MLNQAKANATKNCAPIDDPAEGPKNNQCPHSMNGRNLVVCIDGTANQFGEKNTNVIELYNLILKEDEHNQRTWYNSGIGTYARPSWKSFKFYRQVISHKIDLAIAWNFEKTILAAYRWLSDNYQSGDCIYLFGFSRGAYQVRTLSAMIDKVGLIYKGNESQIPFAYELYSDPKSHLRKAAQVGSSQKQEKTMTMAERFKNAFSYKDVKVHFVGAWDTVSSIGIAGGKSMLPGTIDGMKHVCYFRHALALDERRVKFLPEFAYGGSATAPTKPENKEFLPESTNPLHPTPSTHPRMLEVWFAGTHSDIGGGNVVNVGMDRSRPPLRWMVFEAGTLGLRTAPFERELAPNEQIQIKESLTTLWWPLETLFFKRLTYTRRVEGKETTHKPHLGFPRKIHPGQKIHSSLTLTDKTNGEYTPKARPLDDNPGFWTEARTKHSEWLELDLYEYAETLVKYLITESPGIALQTLCQTMMSADGLQAVYDGVIKVLKDRHTQTEEKCRLLQAAVDIVGRRARQSRPLELGSLTEIRDLVSDVREGNKKLVQQFLGQFTDCCIFVMNGHTRWITSVAFSPDGARIVSGSSDKTIRIWDVETGNQFRASADKTVWIWDAVMGKPVGEPLRGHTDWVTSVAFSPDGGRIVSGSGDKTIRIWDVEMGNQVGEPFRGHTGYVWSVAFSPDENLVVSGSWDETVRIWEAATGKPVGEPLRGHTDRVQSVAFSPDGNRIVSGSVDETIRIWDVEMGNQVGEPFRGHTGPVSSVAFSPDGKWLVSGSADETVRIWDVETGKPVGYPLRGHTDLVNSVAFSPDGRRIVSGSHDMTIRIWDVEAAVAVARL